MNKSNQLLADITAFRTYAKYLAHLGRRESLAETINRNMNMHLERYPKLSKDIVKAFQRVHDYKVMPSMRGMQFAGEAILKNNARLFNCSYCPIDDVKAFSEGMFLLLSGVDLVIQFKGNILINYPKYKYQKKLKYTLFMIRFMDGQKRLTF